MRLEETASTSVSERTKKTVGSEAADFKKQAILAKQDSAKLTPGERPMVTVVDSGGVKTQQPFIGPIAAKPGPDGQTTHEYKKNESLDDIAKRYGLSKSDLLLTNPNLEKQTPKPGDKLIVLADTQRPNIAKARVENAREMAETKDPKKLEKLIAEDIELATLSSATPEDMIDDVKAQLNARRPGDKAFKDLVDTQSAMAESVWRAQGRTHEVFDPLNKAANSGDWQKVEDLAKGVYATFAKTTPKAGEITKPRDMLLTYGPNNEPFRKAVRDAEREFLVDDPKRAADDIRKAYEEGGVVQGAEKLRELTNPKAADPLTAASIVNDTDLKPTLMQMVDDYGKVMTPATGIEVGGALSSALDNASRTEDKAVEGLIKDVADRFIKSDVAFQFDMGQWVQKGDGLTLPLEIASQLRKQGRTEDSDHIVNIAVGAQSEANKENRKLMEELEKAELPLTLPVLNANGYLREGTDSELDKWIADHPDEVEKIKEARTKVNDAGYNLTRSLAAFEKYESELKGSEHYDKVLDQLGITMHVGPNGPLPPDEQIQKGPTTNDPALSRMVSLSEEGMIDSARALNLQALENGTSYDPYSLIDKERQQTIADPSWPIRMVRNHIQSDFVAADKPRPAGLGLSLFGTGTYAWGVKSHGQEFLNKVEHNGLASALFSKDGWRNAGFLTMYGIGIGIEGKQALNYLRSQPLSAQGAFLTHLKGFGWWNVLGTGNYIAQGDGKRAAALGSAAGGTLWSTTLATWRNAEIAGEAASTLSKSWFGKALKFGKFGGPVSTALTLAGSAAIWGIDQHERVELSNLTEPYAADYYTRMGVPHEIARHLGNNDKNGLDPFARFDKIVEHTGLSQTEFMDWLVGEGKKPGGEEFVGDFIEKAVHQVEPDDNGNFKMADADGNDLTVYVPSYNKELAVVGEDGDDRWRVKVGDQEISVVKDASIAPRPKSIKGIVLWSELNDHALPKP